MKPIAMLYSGGMDSFTNRVIMENKEDDTPITYFYFRHGLDEDKELINVNIQLKDKCLNIIDDLNLFPMSQNPPFVPFRNLFFGLYIIGLGFDRLLYSFSAEDTIFYDTTNDFMKELTLLAKNHLGRDVEVFSNISNMSRIDMVDYMYHHKHEWGHFKSHTHTCSNSYPPCRKCVTCFMREIAFAKKDSFVIDEKDFYIHWTVGTARTCISKLYYACRNGSFTFDNTYKSVGRDYLTFLELYKSGFFLDYSY